jgi:hypothetical protein
MPQIVPDEVNRKKQGTAHRATGPQGRAMKESLLKALLTDKGTESIHCGAQFLTALQRK